jgi:hypothetical protein
MLVVASFRFSLPHDKLNAAHYNYTALEERVKRHE